MSQRFLNITGDVGKTFPTYAHCGNLEAHCAQLSGRKPLKERDVQLEYLGRILSELATIVQ